MAPVNQGYSDSAQKLKYHFIQMLPDTTCKIGASLVQKTVGDIRLSSFQLKVSDLWNALLKENFVFSFKNTLEIKAYNSLESEYSKWDWRFHEKVLEWELRVENQISTANLDKVPAIVKQKCQELPKFISEELYKPLKAEMEEFFKASRQSEILAQWKAKFETKLENLRTELRQRATNRCETLGRSKAAITEFERKRQRYTDDITDKVQDLIASLKMDQEKLNQNLERGNLELQKLLKQELFEADKLERYQRQGLLKDHQLHQIQEIMSDAKPGQLKERHLKSILLGGVLSKEEVRKILKQGRLREDELKAQFDKQWIELLKSIPFVQNQEIDIEAAVEKKLIDFVGRFEGQLIGKLQEKCRWEGSLKLMVEEKKHYEKIKGSTLGMTVDWISKHFFRTTDPHQMNAQIITDKLMDEASDYLQNTCKKDTDFCDTFIQELLRLLDNSITNQSANFAKNFTFLPQYRLDVYLTVCRYAVGRFKKMAATFREKHDPRLYLERHKKIPLFTRFKNQYYQTEAEEAIANNLCAHLEEPLLIQVRKLMGSKMVTKMITTEAYFQSKMSLKAKVLHDLYKDDDFESYMTYVTDVKKSFKHWIHHYTMQFCDEVNSDNETRMQLAAKLEVTQLIGVVENKVCEINETDVNEWLSVFCESPKLQTELGVKLKAIDLLSDQESIQQLNLENFKHQIRVGLEDLKQKLHTSLDGIKSASEMKKWKDKPYDLLSLKLLGCSAQCPFCCEQCELLEHDPKEKRHMTNVHRPSCLAGWRYRETGIMVIKFCPAQVASEGSFYISSTSDETHPFKRYDDIYPEWHIPGDPSSHESLYWKYFVSKYSDAIARKISAKAASVPSQWSQIEWEQIKANLNDQYHLFSKI